MEWISVEERLPGPDRAHYVVTAQQDGEKPWVTMSFWNGNDFILYEPAFVTAWWPKLEPAQAPLPPKEPVADGWISVEERLPEDRMHYLVACAWNGIRWVTKLLWDGYRFHIKQANSIVTHWQPLPELPEPAEPPEPAESPPAFFIGAPREDSTYRGVYHITGRWVEGFSDEGEAIRLRDRLNKLWLQDKGSTKETP